MAANKEEFQLFNTIKNNIQAMDPVWFAEKYLTLDGKPFRLNGNGYKPHCDIYRYIGIKALESTAKPVIVLKSRQIGLSTAASVLEMFFCGSGQFGGNTGRPPIRIIHAFPELGLAAAYSKTKLNTMIVSSMPVEGSDGKKSPGKTKSYMQNLLDTTTESNDSLSFKQFAGGNHIWIESTGLTGDRLRGRTSDVIFYDEIQSMTGQAIGNSLKILTTAKYGPPGKGVQVYFGTPLGKGSDFHKMWQTSTQQYYYLGCESCHKHFPLYTPGSDDWEKIWLHGFIVKCTHCGHEQDKRPAAERGKWISSRSENVEDCQMIGFHINQLYMPIFTKEDIINEKPGIHPINTERVYRNEVLGEFFQGDASPITPEEIREMCGEPERKFSGVIPPKDGQMIVLGLDYGAKADLEQLANPNKVKMVGQSYSTAVVLSVRGPNLLSIENAFRFKRNDFESKKGIIDQVMRQYSVNLAIGDIGYSNDLSEVLQNIYGEKYLVSRAHNKINNFVKFNKEIFPKEIIFEKDHYYAEVFDMLKKGNIKFPFGSYDQVSWLINHCSSMELKPSISRAGEPTIHYVKGSGSNDGLAALVNAYLAYKFLISSGFTSNNPFVQQQNLKDRNKPPIILGHINRLI